MTDATPDATPPGAFPQTRWTRVVDLHSNDPSLAERALTELCEIYWLPIYLFFRRNQKNPDDSKDLTQGLFAQIIARGDFLSAEAAKGKLRTFLLTLAQRYLIGIHRQEHAQKRGGASTTFSLDTEDAESRYRHQAIDHLTPEKLFDRQWAAVTIESAKKSLAEDYANRGRSEQFKVLARYLSWNESGEADYTTASAEAGLSEEAFRAAVSRMRKRFRSLLREHVADTLLDTTSIDDEIQALFWALRP